MASQSAAGRARSIWVVVTLTVASCVIPIGGDRDTLRARASFDMRCPVEKLQLTEIDAATSGVEGCGHRETYVYNRAAGTWVLNSPGTGRSQPPFETPEPPTTASSPAGVPPGSPPGTIPGAPP